MSDQSDYDLQAMTERTMRNPQSLQRVAVDYLQAKLGGDTVPDPLSPLIQLMEIGSTQTALAINEALALDRRRYGVFANRAEDLYCVMSDTDYLERFSGPAQMPMYIMIPYNDVLVNLVTDPTTGVGRFIIPRYTEYRVKSDYSFTLLYPLEIRRLTSGELQVVYNTELESPIQPLTDNTLDWELRRYPDRQQYLIISTEMLQLKRITSSFTLNAGATMSTTMLFEDLYYYARVYSVGTDGTMTEMTTTHAEYQHDTRVPTAYLQVDSEAKSLTISVPPIYLSNGMVTNDIRVDIYSTKGALNVPMASVDASQYGWDYGVDNDTPELQRYSGMLGDIRMQVWSDGFIWGGHAELDFETLRRRTIYRSNTVETPIMPDQVGEKFSINGYGVTLARDDLTNRIFYGTRQAPVNPAGKYATPIPSGMATVQTTLAAAATLPGSFDNGDRVTLTPKTLFRMTDGVTSILDGSQYPTAIARNQDELISLINDGDYAYTPYHYVLDGSGTNFALRAYYLENQTMLSRQFLAENESTQLSIQTTGVDLSRSATGWVLTIACKPSSNYDNVAQSDVMAQLAFVPYGETALAYMNGTFMGIDKGTWYWQWKLEGNYDFDARDNIYLNNWSIFDTQLRTLGAALTQEFKIIHTVANYNILGLKTADFDNEIGHFLLDRSAVGVQMESVKLRLGTPMTQLWRGARSVAGAQTFETYDEDVYAYYEADEYEIDQETGLDFKIVNGQIVRTLKHAKGDPVLNLDGSHRIAHGAGTVKVIDGAATVASARSALCIIDVFLMSGLYYYSTNAADSTDAQYLAARVADQYLPDMQRILPRPMESTKLFFYPQRCIGPVNIITDNNSSLMLESGLSIQADVSLTDTAYNSERYRDTVRGIIRNVLTDKLQAETVSMMDILAAVKNTVDSGVKGVRLRVYAGDKELDTFSAGDETNRTTIRRLLKELDDGNLGVVEDITYNWERHVPRSEALYSTVESGRTFTSN